MIERIEITIEPITADIPKYSIFARIKVDGRNYDVKEVVEGDLDKFLESDSEFDPLVSIYDKVLKMAEK